MKIMKFFVILKGYDKGFYGILNSINKLNKSLYVGKKYVYWRGFAI